MASQIRVRVTGDKWWKDRVYYLSHGGLEREGVMPALKVLDRKIRATLTDLFSPGGGPGVPYKHGDTGNYLLNLHSLVSPNVLKIVEGDPRGGQEIREGGEGGRYFEIVAWARRKLGVPIPDAHRIAKFVKTHGVGHGNSPLKNEYPTGVGEFKFPEWIITQKNKDDIDDVARQVDSLIVRYLN